MTDDNYLKARDEACDKQYHRVLENQHANGFLTGADWSRTFTQKEILNSPELKALLNALTHVNCGCYADNHGLRPMAKEALENFNKRWGC